MQCALPLLLILAACRADDRRPPPPPVPATAPAPSLTNATQADLAGELDAAERDGTWLDVRRRWHGQRLRWTVTRHRVLCRTAGACNVAAFPVARPAKHGWLPALELSADQFAALEATCGAADPCELTLEGTLSTLEVSGELPTSLGFSDVTIAGAVTASR